MQICEGQLSNHSQTKLHRGGFDPLYWAYNINLIGRIFNFTDLCPLAIGAFHVYVCDQSYNKFPKICFIKPIWKSQIWANEHKTFNPILNLHKYASIRFLVTCHCYLQKKLPRLRVWRLCGQGFWINAASGNISVKYTKRDMNVDL